MSSLSNYAENALVNVLLRGVAFTPPTPYIALFTAVSDSEVPTGTEVAVGGYARQAATFGAPSNGLTALSAAVEFGALSGSGTATHAAIYDAVSGGNALTAITPLAVARAWVAGDFIRLPAGDTTFQLL